MTDRTIKLDERRGMAAQKATELRRLMSEVQSNEAALRGRQDELERHMLAAPAQSWAEAAEKASYLLALFSATPQGQDPRRQALIAHVLEDFARLSEAAEAHPHPAAGLNGSDDAVSISFQCPRCGHDLSGTIGNLKANRQLVCAGCGVGIHFDTDRLSQSVAGFVEAVQDVAPPDAITIKFFR
jgi:predicted RNA-binding Zn-ribbon protein involved in translation (DUF1610 family)